MPQSKKQKRVSALQRMERGHSGRVDNRVKRGQRRTAEELAEEKKRLSHLITRG